MRRALVATLLSSITLTAAAAPVTPANDAPAPTSRAVSTGVTGVRLVYAPHIHIPVEELPPTIVSSAKLVLAIHLDETGSPTTISVVHPITQSVDARVLEGVRQFRWSPAVLNNRTVPSELTLTVEVQR